MWLNAGAVVLVIASQRPISAQVTCGMKLQSTPTPSSVLRFLAWFKGNLRKAFCSQQMQSGGVSWKGSRMKLSGYVTELCSLENSLYGSLQ